MRLVNKHAWESIQQALEANVAELGYVMGDWIGQHQFLIRRHGHNQDLLCHAYVTDDGVRVMVLAEAHPLPPADKGLLGGAF